MAQNSVKIRFVDIVFANKFGTKPLEYPASTAEKMVSQGKAVYVDGTDAGDKIANTKKGKEDKKSTKRDFCVPVFEGDHRTPTCWVGPSQLPQEILEAADNCGFSVHSHFPKKFSISALLSCSMILVGSDLSSFYEDEQVILNTVLYQKRIPYILVCFPLGKVVEKRRLRNAILRAKSLLFLSDETMDEWVEQYDAIITKWICEDDPYQIWKGIGRLVK